MDFLNDYGLFLAKTVTLLIALIILLVVLVGVGHKQRRVERGHIEVRSLNDAIESVSFTLKDAVLNPEALKQDVKNEKKRAKALQKSQKQAARPARIRNNVSLLSTLRAMCRPARWINFEKR